MRSGIGKAINTETAFILSLASFVFAFIYKANHPNAPFEMFVTGVLGLCGGFWWKRFKQQVIKNGEASFGGKVDPLMEGGGK